MNQTDANIRQIRKSLEEDFEEGDTIYVTDLEKPIENHAGYDRRTKKKYKDILKEKGIITEGEKSGKFTLEKLLIEDEEKKDVDYTADKKNVTVRINKDAVKKADTLNVNKSDFFNRKLLERVSTIEDDIEEIAEKKAEEEEDIPFIRDLVMQRAFRNSKNEEKRKEIYRKHFGNYNDFACEELRKTAFKVAEELGLVDKPKGVK